MMATGMPVAFCFLLINLVGILLFWGGAPGLELLILTLFTSVTRFTLLPLPLFVLMGEVIFHSGIAPNMLDALDRWLGRLPGRLGLVAVGGGTLFATLTGVSMASVAMLGSTLVPEMEKRGYKKPMSLGPILGSGGLAFMIPPSGLVVLLAALAEISIGKTLMAIIIPGLLMATLYASYIIIRCKLQPSIAPAYDVPPTSLSEKLIPTVRYVLPVGFVIFMVIGVIFLGVATPTEAAATGAIATFILAAGYKRLNWQMVKKSVAGGLKTTLMILMILTGAAAFSQILASSGASRGLAGLAVGLPVVPMVVFIGMQIGVIFLGMFMGASSVIMITIPLFMPIVDALGFNSVWFAVVMMLGIEMGTTSPPFGMSLFVMKGVAPPDTTMGDIYRAALPFLYCDLLAMALITAFPLVALWLPGLMLR